jgi:hypothetical protein
MKCRLVSLFAAVFIAGCATAPVVRLYDGPDRRESELATVAVPYQIEISEINGTGIPWRSGFQATEVQDYQLLPGRYTFRFRFSSPYEFGDDNLGVTTPTLWRVANLAPGRRYAFQSKVSGHNATTAEVHVEIIDVATGQRVDEELAQTAPVPETVVRPTAPQSIEPKQVAVPEPEAVPMPAPDPVAAPDAPAPVADEHAAPETVPAPEAAPAATENTQADRLKQAWDNATAEERAELLKHIAK